MFPKGDRPLKPFKGKTRDEYYIPLYNRETKTALAPSMLGLSKKITSERRRLVNA